MPRKRERALTYPEVLFAAMNMLYRNGWSRGAYARDHNGRPTSICLYSVSKPRKRPHEKPLRQVKRVLRGNLSGYCVRGAIVAACVEHGISSALADAYLNAFDRYVAARLDFPFEPGRAMVAWNDILAPDFDEVVSWLRQAAREAQEQAEAQVAALREALEDIDAGAQGST